MGDAVQLRANAGEIVRFVADSAAIQRRDAERRIILTQPPKIDPIMRGITLHFTKRTAVMIVLVVDRSHKSPAANAARSRTRRSRIKSSDRPDLPLAVVFCLANRGEEKKDAPS